MLLEEGHAGHEHAGRAVAALKAVLRHETLLERVQLAVLLEPFHGRDLAPVRLDGEDRAGLDGPAVEQDGARAAVCGVTADVRAGQPEHVADQVDQQQPRLRLRFVLFAVDRHLDAHGSHLPPARSIAFLSARAVSTLTRSFLYSTEPLRSADGWAASLASSAARLIAASSGRFPRSAASAASALIGVGPTFARPMPTCVHTPPASRSICTATAAAAKSPTFRSTFT